MTLLHYKLWQQEKELATQVLKTQQKIQLLGSLAIFSILCKSCKHFQLKIVWEWLTTRSWKYGRVGLNDYNFKQTFYYLCFQTNFWWNSSAMFDLDHDDRKTTLSLPISSDGFFWLWEGERRKSLQNPFS